MLKKNLIFTAIFLTILLSINVFSKDIKWKQFAFDDFQLIFELPDYLSINTNNHNRNTTHYFVASDNVNYTITVYSWKGDASENKTVKDIAQTAYSHYSSISNKVISAEEELNLSLKIHTMLGKGDVNGKSVYFYLTGMIIPDGKAFNYVYITFAWWDLQNYNKFHEKLSRDILDHVKAGRIEKIIDPKILSPYGDTQLHIAALQGDISFMEKLLAARSEINALNHGNSTPLHLAVDRGQKEAAELLLKYKANVNLQDKWGRTPLLIAVENGYPEIAEALLNNGADVNLADTNERTPLYIILRRHNYDRQPNPLVEKMINAGADVNHKITCAKNGRNDQNCDNLYDKNKTLLHWAAFNGHTEAAEMLSNHGADLKAVDNKGLSALHFAAYKAHNDIVRMLLERNADPNIKDKNQDTPLILAVKTSYPLVGHKYGRNYFINMLGGRAQYFQALDPDNRRYETCKILLDAGAKTNTTGGGNMLPIHWAAYNGFTSIVKLLTERGAQYDLKDKDGMTPLYLAVREQHTEIAKYLIFKGANINIQVPHSWGDEKQGDERFITPLHWSCRKKMNEVTNILVNKGAKLNVRDRDGMTPLFIAAFQNNLEAVKLLISKGADTTITDNDGKSWAEQIDNAKIKTLITEKK